VPTGWVSVALDRTGKTIDSLALAETLLGWNDSSIRGVAFVIGGAVGLDPAFAQRCTMRLSLGAMTFPHDLALVLVAEQIYRAATIVKRLPYHR
jgi:23S rRNA (pseudouridine1915-N3)-methyltransferase